MSTFLWKNKSIKIIYVNNEEERHSSEPWLPKIKEEISPGFRDRSQGLIRLSGKCNRSDGETYRIVNTFKSKLQSPSRQVAQN